MSEFLPLLAGILPFILWPLEQLFPYPSVVEEVAKAVIIFLCYKSNSPRKPIFIGLAMGIAFAISESIFYLFSIAPGGDVGTYATRLILTILMHTITSSILAGGLMIPNRRFMASIAFLLAVAIHFIYNLIASYYSGFSFF